MSVGDKHKNLKLGALAAAIGVASGTAPAATFTVNTTASEGIGSLAFAMGLAAQNGEDDTINITATGTIDMRNASLIPHADPVGSLTIVGPGRDLLTILGRDQTARDEILDEPDIIERAPAPIIPENAPLFLSVSETTLSISGLTIDGADYGAVVSGYGEASGDVVLSDVRITGSDGYGETPQVLVAGADLTITDSVLDNHSGRAPVVTAFGSEVEISGTEISNNSNQSAAVFAIDADLEITESLISGNTNPVAEEPLRIGGPEQFKYLSPGVVGLAVSVEVKYSVFENNRADFGTGAGLLVLPTDPVVIAGTSFSGNQTTSGGALSVVKYGGPGPAPDDRAIDGPILVGPGGGLPIIIQNSTFSGNQAKLPQNPYGEGGGPKYGAGGAILAGGNVSLVVEESVFTGNSAEKYGGSIAAFEMGQFVLTDSLVEDNTAGQGGGAIALQLRAYAEGFVAGSTITGNKSDNGTGGIDVALDEYADFRLESSTISDNSTKGSEGAVSGFSFLAFGESYSSNSLDINQSTISGNKGDGPAFEAEFRGYSYGSSGRLSVENSTFSGNESAMARAPIVLQGFDEIEVEHSTFVDNEGAGVDAGQVHVAASSEGYSEVDVSLVRSVLTSNNDVEVILNASELGLDGSAYGSPDSMNVEIENTIITQGDLAYGNENTSITRSGGLANDGIGIDPGLGALANNGGLTETHAPLSAASAVVDVGEGESRPDNVDQRGVDEDASVDLGSVEYVGPEVNTAPTLLVNIGKQISGNVGFVLPEPIPVAEAFEDAEGDEITVVSVTGLPAGLEYDDGEITGELLTQGEYQVKVTVQDDGEPSLSTTATFDVKVGDGQGPSAAETAVLLDDDDDDTLGGTPLAFFGTLAAMAWLRRRRR